MTNHCLAPDATSGLEGAPRSSGLQPDLARRARDTGPRRRPDESPSQGSGARQTAVIELMPRAGVPVAGQPGRLPVQRIFSFGRNYAEHAREMGFDPRTGAPLYFCKPASSALAAADGRVALPYPPCSAELQHDVELVVAIGRGGREIAAADAAAFIWGYAIGLDMTRRNLQQAIRRAGKPWEIGKTFEHCAPVGPLTPIDDCGGLRHGAITLDVDGQRHQAGDLAQLIWPVDEIIAALSRHLTLRPGDLIFIGTPEGVGPVRVGQTLRAAIEGLAPLELAILPPAATALAA